MKHRFRGASATNVYFGYWNLKGVNFFWADFSGASLDGRQIFGMGPIWNLCRIQAQVSNAILTGIHLGAELIQESDEAYNDYFARWYASDVTDKTRHGYMSKRFRDAEAEIYMNLKNAFLSSGLYSRS